MVEKISKHREILTKKGDGPRQAFNQSLDPSRIEIERVNIMR
jgi:hypothetical protein